MTTREEVTAQLNARMSQVRADRAAIRIEDVAHLTATEIAALPRYPHTGDDRHRVLLRYPRVAAHLICASLGYLTPCSAANAIRCYQQHEPFYCEWYTSMAGESYDRSKIIAVGTRTMKSAITLRRHHTGFMAEYLQARSVILKELDGDGPLLASWF